MTGIVHFTGSKNLDLISPDKRNFARMIVKPQRVSGIAEVVEVSHDGRDV